MRRTVAVLAAMTVISLLAVGMAYPATKVCDTPTCNGTDKRDTIADSGGPDQDTIYAGSGRDVIDVREGKQQ